MSVWNGNQNLLKLGTCLQLSANWVDLVLNQIPPSPTIKLILVQVLHRSMENRGMRLKFLAVKHKMFICTGVEPRIGGNWSIGKFRLSTTKKLFTLLFWICMSVFVQCRVSILSLMCPIWFEKWLLL